MISIASLLRPDDTKVDTRFLGIGIRGFLFLITLVLTYGLWVWMHGLVLIVLGIQILGIAYFQFSYAKRVYGLNRKFAYQLPQGNVESIERLTTIAFAFTILLMLSMYLLPAIEIMRWNFGALNWLVAALALIPFFAVKMIVSWLEGVRE